MSWSCPHLKENRCELHQKKCRPGKGKCILKGKYKISTLEELNMNEPSTDSEDHDENKTN